MTRSDGKAAPAYEAPTTYRCRWPVLALASTHVLSSVEGGSHIVPHRGFRPAMSIDSVVRSGASSPRSVSRRGLLRCAGLLGAAGVTGVAGWAVRGTAVPLAARAAEGKQIVWSKDAVRVYLVEAGRIVRTMACVQNTWKTPNGTYTVWSYERAVSYYEGRQVDLPDFAPFYRRPGASWNIGFHAIPVWADGPDAGEQIHDDELLGTDLESEGCVRLAATDAAFLRSWAPVGTSVVVQDGAYMEESPTPTPEPVPTEPAAASRPDEQGEPTLEAEPLPSDRSAVTPCEPTRRWFWPWRTSC